MGITDGSESGTQGKREGGNQVLISGAIINLIGHQLGYQ